MEVLGKVYRILCYAQLPCGWQVGLETGVTALQQPMQMCAGPALPLFASDEKASAGCKIQQIIEHAGSCVQQMLSHLRQTEMTQRCEQPS